MHRTMLYIAVDDYNFLLKKSKVMGKSLSEMVREAIRYYIDRIAKRPDWGEDPLWSSAGLGSSELINDDSVRHDEILYGEGMESQGASRSK